MISNTYWIFFMYLLDPHSFEIASWGCWYTFFSKQSYSPMMFMSLQLQLTLDKNATSMNSSLVTFSIGNKEEIIESMVGFASLYPCGRIKLALVNHVEIHTSLHLSIKKSPLKVRLWELKKRSWWRSHLVHHLHHQAQLTSFDFEVKGSYRQPHSPNHV